MKFNNKAMLNRKKKIRGISAIALLCCIVCVAIIFGVYSVIKANYVVAGLYAVAFLLGIMYTIMKINTVMPMFLANDDENLYMRYWNNGFFPFRIDKGIIGEFIPEKIKSSKIVLSGITKVYVGSGSFLLRTLKESKFAAKVSENKKKYLKVIKRTEFIHLTLASGKERYMPVTDFDPEKLADIIRDIKKVNEDLQFTSANRKVRRLVEKVKYSSVETETVKEDKKGDKI